MQGITDPEQRRLLATIGGQALRVRDMIGDVMLFARPPAPHPESLDLSAAVADVLDRLRDELAESSLVIFNGPRGDCACRSDAVARGRERARIDAAAERRPDCDHVPPAGRCGDGMLDTDTPRLRNRT
jgi:signal transduction histidine kinase